MQTRNTLISSKKLSKTQNPKEVPEDLSSLTTEQFLSLYQQPSEDSFIIKNIVSSSQDEGDEDAEDTSQSDQQLKQRQPSFNGFKKIVHAEDSLNQDVRKTKRAPKRPTPAESEMQRLKKTTKKRKSSFLEASIPQNEEVLISKIEWKKEKNNLICADQIYRCKCGNQCVTASGIRRHIKSSHMKSLRGNLFYRRIKEDVEGTLKFVTEVSFKDSEEQEEKQKTKRKACQSKKNKQINSESLVKIQFASSEIEPKERHDQGFVEVQKITNLKQSSDTIRTQIHEMLLKQYQELLTQKLHDDREYLYNSEKLIEKNMKILRENQWLRMRISCFEDKPKTQTVQSQAHDKGQRQQYMPDKQNDVHQREIQADANLSCQKKQLKPWYQEKDEENFF